MVFVVFIICAAIVSSLFRAMTPWAEQYKGDLEKSLSGFLKKKVSIESMETSWYWFEPVIKLQQVRVTKEGDSRPLVAVNKLLIGINVLSSLWHWQVQPGLLYADGVQLSLRQNGRRWQIEGLNDLGLGTERPSYQPLLAWILAREKIVLKDVSGQLYLNNQMTMALKDWDMVLLRSSDRFRIKSELLLKKERLMRFQLRADLRLPDDYALEKSQGKLYVSAQSLDLSLIHQLLPLPQSPLSLEAGFGDILLWLDWKKGRIESAQSQIHMASLAFKEKGQVQAQAKFFPFFHANLSFSQAKQKWKLSADKIQMVTGKTRWPENSLILEGSQKDRQYQLYVHHLLLKPLLSLLSFRPEVASLAAMKLHGVLTDTQCQFRGAKLDFLLTSFSQLGWQEDLAKKLPQVDNLKGALNWQPEEGLLELESENVLYKAANTPPFKPKTLSALINWKALSHGMRIHIDNFVLNDPELLLSARGDLDEVTTASLGKVDLDAQVSAQNLPQFLIYTTPHFKESKLYGWLHNNVKKIDKIAAEIKIQGRLEDFPFDKAPGEFKIKGLVNNMDLTFTPAWPLTKDIEAFVQVDKQKLDIDVVRAKLQDIQVTNANVKIEDIGSGRETLLLHTNMDASGEDALAYLKASPLYKPLKKTLKLQGTGDLNLNLRLELPLYAPNNGALSLGALRFNNNSFKGNYDKTSFNLDSLAGFINFDEKGILDGNLKANLFGYPVTAILKSVFEPREFRIELNGKSSIDALMHHVELPILAYLKGEFWFDGLMIFEQTGARTKKLHLSSSLQGVSMDLPPPFSKAENTSLPMTVDVDINPKGFLFQSKMDNTMMIDLSYGIQDGQYRPKQGSIRLGKIDPAKTSTSMPTPSSPSPAGVVLLGRLNSLEVGKWQTILEKVPFSEMTRLVFESINSIDLFIADLNLNQRQFSDLSFKAVKKIDKAWQIRIDQKNLIADLSYRVEKNSLTGTFAKWRIEKKPEKEGSGLPPQTFTPKNMPNIDWKIKELEYNDLALGEASIRGKRVKNDWQLDFCKIETSFYQITAQGLWSGTAPEDKTSLSASMVTNSLAKTLAFWKLNPVVDADKGRIDFEGGWAGAIYNVALDRITGEFNLEFKNGIVSNLNEETEKKLGLGKLISILSLQTLPRRLKLDFSDLSRKGYSFDVFKGNFFLDKGLLSTDNSFINGPIAYVDMKGSLDVSKQLYDMTLKVTPYVTASLPLVATIAGGPVAGIATWVASKIISKGMQKVSGYTYKISGPWKQPIVQQVSIHKVN